MIEIVSILPPLIVLFTALSLLFLSSFEKISTQICATVSVVFLIIALCFSFYLQGNLYSLIPFYSFLHDFFIVDSFSNYFNMLLLISAILFVLSSKDYVLKSKYSRGEFHALLLFSLFGMMLFANSNELITAYLALEIASLSIFILIAFDKSDQKKIEAIFKYFVLNIFVGIFYLLGVALLFGTLGTTHLSEFASAISLAEQSQLILVYISTALILFVFIFKIASFPFHAWALDVYKGTPAIVLAVIISIFKVAIFSFFIRFLIKSSPEIKIFLEDILIVLVLLAFIFGTFFAVSQSSIKKVFIGSSMVHAGYLLLGFIVIAKDAQSIGATLFYLFAYCISFLGAFCFLANMEAQKQIKITYEDFKGMAHEQPFLAALITIFTLSLAGVPLTIGFAAKFYLLIEAVKADYVYLAILATLATFVSVYYYFKLIVIMYSQPKNSNLESKIFDNLNISTIALTIIAILIIWGGTGSVIAFFLPIPNIDNMLDLIKISVDSLMLKK